MDQTEIKTIAQVVVDRGLQGDQVFAIFSGSDRHLSYRDHYLAARRVARRLVERFPVSWHKGIRVLIIAPTGADLLAALSGCWLAGALAAPIDSQQTQETLQQILVQLKPRVLLIDKRIDKTGVFETAARQAGCAVIEDIAQQNDWPIGDMHMDIAPEDPSLVIFTSGSTGLPKGVVLSQHNLVVGGRNVITAKRLTAQDRALCVLPLSHLNGLVTTYISPLVSGGSVAYLQGAFEPMLVLNLIDRHQCSWFSAVPTQFGALLKPPVAKSHWHLKSLRFCRSASFSLHPKVRSEFESHYGVPVIETMGMSETTAQIFSNPQPPGLCKTGSVGQPIGFEVKIINDKGDVCAAGEEGEIHIRGAGLMLGYLDSPDETAKAFDHGWLKSGDLGVRDEDNYFYITGRKKDIAIFGGINVSLRHLENRVLDAKLVDEIRCVAELDDDFGERIVAYVKANCDAADLNDVGIALIGALTQLLANRLALKEVRFVEALPRIGVGKVAKGKLHTLRVLHRMDLLQAMMRKKRNDKDCRDEDST